MVSEPNVIGEEQSPVGEGSGTALPPRPGGEGEVPVGLLKLTPPADRIHGTQGTRWAHASVGTPWPPPGAQMPLGCSITGPDATATDAESSDFKGKNKRLGAMIILN